ncbi:MAG: hypothetical protein GEU73_12265 [Chloroflexi bacterium]|nr:hypothetical protein [Chloroflexota bacterium]
MIRSAKAWNLSADRTWRQWVHLVPMFLVVGLMSGCFAQTAAAPQLFDLEQGQVYGPVPAPPISIQLGQSVIKASGSVGPTDGPEGSPAIWEGHALDLEPDQERNRTLFFFIEGEDLQRVTLQINDQEPLVEELAGVYLSGELSMVRWAQEYSLRVTAESSGGTVVSSVIHVTGEDARIESTQPDEQPLRMRMLRMGPTHVREVQGAGYQGKIYRHVWPTCTSDCDLTTPGGVLMAFVSGPADTLLLLLDGAIPHLATGLSYWPNPDYLLVAIPVREESLVEIAALSGAGDMVTGRWDRPAT